MTLPNKIFEYVAAGLPILSSDMAVSGEFVRRHGIGEVVAADDPAAIAAGLDRLLDAARADELRGRISQAAREFTWDHERRHLIEAYAAAVA